MSFAHLSKKRIGGELKGTGTGIRGHTSPSGGKSRGGRTTLHDSAERGIEIAQTTLEADALQIHRLDLGPVHDGGHFVVGSQVLQPADDQRVGGAAVSIYMWQYTRGVCGLVFRVITPPHSKLVPQWVGAATPPSP